MIFGSTWWGENWLNALKGVDFTNRIPRGKSYANTGRVYDIEIDENNVTSKVKGKSYHHYETSISFKRFTEEEKEKIIETINNSPSLLSALLNHQLPTELYEELLDNGINVFPTSVDDITPDCNCPDYAYICKHIAGLVYMIAHEVDKDPFQVFKLQGCDLLKLLDYKKTTDDIKSIEDLFTNTDDIDENKVSTVDYSIIPDLLNPIFVLLQDYPVFYQYNFKKILNDVVKSMARYAKKENESYSRNMETYYNDYIILPNYEELSLDTKEEDTDEWFENVFINKWGKPNQWEHFTIDLDNNYDISKIQCDGKSALVKAHSPLMLYAFLMELSDSPIERYNKNIQFISSLHQFTVDLIKNHALIPELFKSNDYYHIRWIPAFFDKSISQIIDNLIVSCPNDLITFDGQELSKKDQIITCVSLIVKGFFNNYLAYGTAQTIRKRYTDNIFRLFFFESQKLDDVGEEGYENLINQWLSKFIINTRDYDLYLVINEYDGLFDVDIQVSTQKDDMENIYDVIKKTKNEQLKSQLLSDTYLINEIIPEIRDTINLNDLEFGLEEFSNFFINTLPLFEIIGINIILPKNLQKIFEPKLQLNISGNQNEKGYITFEDITQFDWKIAVGDNQYDVNEFKKLAEKSRGLVRLANEYVILDEDQTKTLIKQIDKLPEKLNQHELMKALLSQEMDYAEVVIDEQLNDLVNTIKKNTITEIPELVDAELREYQKTGFSWLVQNIKTGFGSILADDMGLGKTLQVLTTIQHFKDEGLLEKEKVLVIAPTSLLTNWQKEISRFTPDLTSFIYHGAKRRFPKEEYDIYLTSYGVIRRDEAKFKKKKWFLSVIDEAQNIKNPNTKQSRAVKSVKARHRIALSGTPVENRLSEYWSIFDFINRGYLTSLKRFRKNYIQPIEKERNQEVLENFKLITEPFILRRLKSDKNVIKDLPDKITNDIYCNLNKTQVSLYQETLNLAKEELETKDGIERKGVVLKLINSLKQICNHPSQFTKSKYADISDSGKMEVLMNILENILESNEKVLIFTQFVKMGEIIQRLAEEKFNEEVLFLHGSLSRKKRDELVDKFQNNTQNKIFVVSLRAGGTGLNLTAASNVIHYDLWWNPAVENQATDRAYRIGQTDNVMVYRFITTGTFEERINDMIHDKRELAEITVGSGEKFITEMNDKELMELLTLRKE